MKELVIPILAMVFSIPLGVGVEAQDRAVTSEWVQRFEQSLDLNQTLVNERAYRRHLSLESYALYYEIGVIDGGTFVSAVYAIPSTREPGVYIGGPLPIISDGGCSVVTLRIDLETLQVLSARCNGRG